jgi:hypothetical protein
METIEVRFYLKGEDTTEIVTFNNLASNPFKVGDVVNLNVNSVPLRELVGYKIDFQRSVNNTVEKSKRLFNLKKASLIKESKHITINHLSESKIIIEYTCEILAQ